MANLAGSESYSPGGILQHSSEFASMTLHSKGSANTGSKQTGNTNPSSLYIDVPAALEDVLLALSCASGIAFIRRFVSGSNWRYEYACAGGVGTTVNYWVFNKPTSRPSIGLGKELFDASGRMTYSSVYDNCVIVDMIGGSADGAPTVLQTSGATGTLAFIQGEFSSHRYANNIQEVSPFGTGPRVPPVADDGSPPPESSGQAYNWTNDGKIYGGRVLNGQCQAVSFTFDDVEVKKQEYPPPDYDNPVRLLVVDVTGL